MNILFLFAQYPEDKDGSNLHKDLPDEFCRHGHGVFVATIRERRVEKETAISQENGRSVLRVKVGNMFDDVSKIEKALVMLSMDRKLANRIREYWGDVKFDLIVGSTPWTAGDRLISDLKIHFKCPAFLILWDIFPQNAKDLGLIKNSLIFNFFKSRELKSLKNFDHIGCMTEGNLGYISKHYPSIGKNKLSIFPLWANKSAVNRDLIQTRQELGFDDNDFILVFGGNMGLPQNLSNVIKLANEVRAVHEIKFLFVGKGSETNKIKALAKELELSNVTFLDHLERSAYEAVMLTCDVGLVSLNPKFTVPNFPSKTMDYVKFNLPILAALDKCALADYGSFIQNKAKIGLCSDAEDMVRYKENLLSLYNDKHLYARLVNNCQETFEKEFNIRANYEEIIALI
jgi:glycosyltransferase involved in cell wall biosynthesis